MRVGMPRTLECFASGDVPFSLSTTSPTPPPWAVLLFCFSGAWSLGPVEGGDTEGAAENEGKDMLFVGEGEVGFFMHMPQVSGQHSRASGPQTTSAQYGLA